MSEPGGVQARTPMQLVGRRLRRDKVALVCVVYLALLGLVAVFAPLLCDLIDQQPNAQDRGPSGLTLEGIPVGPSGDHWLGTDRFGRDILARLLYGSRISLMVGVLATAAQVLLGVVVGVVAGYVGGRVDMVLSRTMDAVLSFPFVLVALSIAAVTGPSVWVSVFVISLFGWSVVGRVVRGQVLAIREREYIEAARSLGAGDARIMRVDVLPNLVSPVIVYASLLIPTNIVAESTLSFLGLGVVPPTASWGGMLAESARFYEVAWWYLTFPALALLLTTLAFNLLGDSLRDALDPRADQVLARK